MKFSLTIFFTILSIKAICQPVQWQIGTKKISDSTYKVIITAAIEQDWWLYASEDKKNGLEAVSLTWQSERVIAQSPQILSPVTIINDPIFGNKQKIFSGMALFEQSILVKGNIDYVLLNISAFASNRDEFIAADTVFTVLLDSNSVGVLNNASKIKLTNVNINKPIADCGDNQTETKSLLTIFLLGIVGGLFAMVTPCVFPMIPVTVSFFMNRSKNKKEATRNGILYGIFIFLIYLIASSPFHLISNIDKNIFNTIATNAWLNVGFFIVFVIFALSFFGLFEITLPGSIATKADSKSSLSSITGIFFMALTLGIVSFSCTGVILGVLLANVAASGPWALTSGMAGFGVALALPFALFAMFPNWLKKLPKSGNWLDAVKKSLAFIELALAFKFLSNADLVEHWGILKREVFIAIWVLISLGLALYLLGIFKKKSYVHPLLQKVDQSKNKMIWPRRALGIATLVFVLYLIPGLTQTKYANLQLLSGFPPPLSYSVYGNENVKGKAVEPNVVNDYAKALQLSQQLNKPLMIDFTGWACVNCRKMEEQVWTKPEIKQLISDKYILVSLYVDDRKKLPEETRFRYKAASGEEKEIKTLGDKWSMFQSENFKQVTQPLYVLLSPDEQLLNHPVGYTPDVKMYKEWLVCGLEANKREKGAVVKK